MVLRLLLPGSALVTSGLRVERRAPLISTPASLYEQHYFAPHFARARARHVGTIGSPSMASARPILLDDFDAQYFYDFGDVGRQADSGHHVVTPHAGFRCGTSVLVSFSKMLGDDCRFPGLAGRHISPSQGRRSFSPMPQVSAAIANARRSATGAVDAVGGRRRLQARRRLRR